MLEKDHFELTDGNYISSNSRQRLDRIRNRAKGFNQTTQRTKVSSIIREYINFFEKWLAHYDFEYWDKIESQFDHFWPSLNNAIQLAIENDLYEDIRDLFFEIRNLLQWTGKVRERIYLSSWLKEQANLRNDNGSMYVALSSLAWSYTSSGCYQNLSEASKIWDELKNSCIHVDKVHLHKNESRKILEELGKDLYSELVMDIHENGVRIAIRHGNTVEARSHISKGGKMISLLIGEELIDRRLQERFELAFQYHTGIIHFLNKDFEEAQSLFDNIFRRASMIGWERVVKGAQSWLATIAMEIKDYAKCESILTSLSLEFSNHPNKRDGICHLIKAQLFDIQGQKDEKLASQEKAIQALKNFSGSFNKKPPNESINSFAFLAHV